MPGRRWGSIAILYGLFAFTLFLTHYRWLGLPFHWDEAGQFVPQAHDLWEQGRILPTSTMPNSHPPGLPVVLAAVWKVFGYSIESTRIVMLLFAAAFFTAAFLLSVELLRGSRGAPAFMAVGLLLANPLVFMQSMMAQLDLPAALFTTLLLFAYVTNREGLAVACAVLAAAFKETSIAIPLTLAVFAWRDGSRQYALQLAIAPVLIVANWVGFVSIATGKLFGDSVYGGYNLVYPLHPVRLAYAFFRRFSYLAVENLHVLPVAILIWRFRRIGFGPLWKPVAAACAAELVLVTVTGGAVLERYLLPVLPVLYIAFAAGMSTLENRWRNVAFGLSALALLAMLFARPPWPYSIENNLAMIDFVEAQRDAAGLVDSRLGRSRVTTAWPLTDALRKPYLGYVSQPAPAVRSIEDFSMERLANLEWRKGDVLIVYARAWNPATSMARWPWVQTMLKTFFRAPQEATVEDLQHLKGLMPVVGLEREGFWVEILVVP